MPRRRRDRRAPERLDLNLTALLDVVLQLIAFFMMLVHFETKIEESGRLVRLPTAPAALPTATLGRDRLVVALDADGVLDAAGSPVAPAADWWTEQAALRRRGRASLGLDSSGSLEELPTRVLIRADRDLPYGTVRSTLAAAQEAGFAQFSLVVLREDG